MTSPNRTQDQDQAASRPVVPAQQSPPAAGNGQPTQQQPTQQQPAQQQPPAQQPPIQGHHKIRRTRMGGAWVTLSIGALILVVLLVFILENLNRVNIAFFGVHGHLPLGVAMLLAAVAGILIVVIPGTGRILQLRRTARRHRKADAKAGSA